MMEFSLFGRRFSDQAGILELMEDLGKAMESPGEKVMLGGGNPASIPAMNRVWRERLAQIVERDEVAPLVAQYDAPGGRDSFRRELAGFLRRQYGWDVGPEHIVVTGGSQAACFLLFNLLSGEFEKGRRHTLLPLAPEYIGYADQGLAPGQFVSRRPQIGLEEAPFFKYHVDFQGLDLTGAGLVAAGRPTNPTGNVLTDDEVRHLAGLAREAGVPFLLDNAYGSPFPSILFEPVEPYWDSNTILSMSLSKLGLPSTRTGILVAPEPVASAVAAANSILTLTNAGLGQALVQPLLQDDSILALCRDVIRPFYRAKRDFALNLVRDVFAQRFPYRVHRPEGALFLWFWFPKLPITSRDLYSRLKERGVIVVPGDAFFFGLPAEDADWEHRRQCVRINYARDEAELECGIRVIAEVVEQARRV